MTNQSFLPDDFRSIKDMEALKTMADPLRNQIMEVLTPHSMTVNQASTKLGVDSSKLYYHFSLLEKHGFIQVVETTQRGILIEKHNRVTAYHFKLADDVFNFNVDTPEGTENIITMLLTSIDATREDLRRSMYARHQQILHGATPKLRSVLKHREVYNLPDEKAKEFHQRLEALLEEFEQEAQAVDTESEETLPWALSVVLYPSFYFDSDPDTTEGKS